MNISEHVERLRVRVKSRTTSAKAIADATLGILSESWVYKFADGRMKNPRLKSLVALDQALTKIETSLTESTNAN